MTVIKLCPYKVSTGLTCVLRRVELERITQWGALAIIMGKCPLLICHVWGSVERKHCRCQSPGVSTAACHRVTQDTFLHFFWSPSHVRRSSALSCPWHLQEPCKVSIMMMVCVCMCVRVCTRSCQILCDPMDCIPPGSSVPGILQERILE